MRHHKAGRHLGRDANERKALFKSLLISLVQSDSIVTTSAKAAALRPLVEKLVTAAKPKNLAASRAVQAALGDKQLGKKFMKDVVPAMTQSGGFISIARFEDRRGDGATLSRVSWVGYPPAGSLPTAGKKKAVAQIEAPKKEKVEPVTLSGRHPDAGGTTK